MMRWSHSFEALLTVTKDRFALRLPLNHRISVETIKYTPVGDYIVLEGTMGALPAPVVQVVDERHEKPPAPIEIGTSLRQTPRQNKK